jgi:hypothetical protein
MSRPEWMTPPEYTEDRFGDDPGNVYDDVDSVLDDAANNDGDAFGVDDEDDFESSDSEPMDYDRGPHDDEFGLDGDDGFESNDREPIDYGNGPHQEEFGVVDGDDD